MNVKALAPIAAALLLAAGCSGGATPITSTSSSSSSTSSAPSLSALGGIACPGEFTEETTNIELYVKAQGYCPDGTYLYVFASNEARDKWADLSQQNGATVWVGDRSGAVAGDNGQAVFNVLTQSHLGGHVL